MMSTAVMSVVLARGGTAGHVNPMLAVADELRGPSHGYDLRPIPRVPLPRRPSTDMLKLPGRLAAAVKVPEQGSDAAESETADALWAAGIHVLGGHDPSHLPPLAPSLKSGEG